MRIAIFAETFLPKWDGIAHTLCQLVPYLGRRGHTTLMFAPAAAPPAYAETPIIGLPALRFPLYPDLKLVRPGVEVTRALAAFKPDLVHLVNPVSLGLAGLRAAHALRLPLASSYHTDVPGYARRYRCGALTGPLWTYFRWLHNQTDLTLCPSHFTARELALHGFRRLKVWGRGVDTERFDPRRRSQPWRARLGAESYDGPLLLYVGRLAVEKRIDWLRPVLDALPAARLAIVGEGPHRRELETLFAGTPTVFAGYLTGQDLACAYAAADIFVFPSANETCGNVVLEAMASALPVVAPASGGVVDHVRPGQTGLLFDPADRAAFVEQIRQLMRDDERRATFGKNGRAYALERRWEHIFDELMQDWTHLLPDSYAGARQPLTWPDFAAALLQTPTYQEPWQG